MVDLAIGAAISGLKAAGEMAGSFVKLRDEAMIQAKVIELQSVILAAQGSALAAQGEQFALLEAKRELEAQISNLEAWAREKSRYQLETIGQNNSLCYGLTAEAKGTGPDHKLCASCFERQHKGYLQPHHVPAGRNDVLMCDTCGSQILVSGNMDTRIGAPKSTASPAAFGRQTLRGHTGGF